MPALVITIASYLTVTRTVVTTVSQAVVADNENESVMLNDIQIGLGGILGTLFWTAWNISPHDLLFTAIMAVIGAGNYSIGICESYNLLT